MAKVMLPRINYTRTTEIQTDVVELRQWLDESHRLRREHKMPAPSGFEAQLREALAKAQAPWLRGGSSPVERVVVTVRPPLKRKD